MSTGQPRETPARATRSARSTGKKRPLHWDDAALADLVARLRRAMRRAARVRDSDNVLSVAQLELLSCLAENPGARPSELARLLRLAPNSVTTLVNGLRSRRLVQRGADSSDRRAVSLTLTPAGDQAVARWHKTNAGILRAALSALPADHQRLLVSAFPALHELIGAIDALAEAQPPAPPSRR